MVKINLLTQGPCGMSQEEMTEKLAWSIGLGHQTTVTYQRKAGELEGTLHMQGSPVGLFVAAEEILTELMRETGLIGCRAGDMCLKIVSDVMENLAHGETAPRRDKPRGKNEEGLPERNRTNAEEATVPVPLSEFEHLVDLKGRMTLLMEYTQGERFSISREKVAHYLGFELREHKED